MYDEYFADSDAKMPLLEDLQKRLLAESSLESSKLATALEPCITGEFMVFNNHTNIDLFNNPLVCFDVGGGFDFGRKPELALLVVQEIAFNMISANGIAAKRTRYYVEELTFLAKRELTAQRFCDLLKRSWVLGGIFTVTTQNIDLFNSGIIREMLNNLSFFYMMSMSRNCVDDFSKSIDIESKCLEFISDSGCGRGIVYLQESDGIFIPVINTK
jgi:hypothetical protein